MSVSPHSWSPSTIKPFFSSALVPSSGIFLSRREGGRACKLMGKSFDVVLRGGHIGLTKRSQSVAYGAFP
jgi:hypothetical protein